MKIFMTGGTGFVGRHLADRLVTEGHEVTVLSRGPWKQASSERSLRFVQGDPSLKGPWQGEVTDHEVLINLAGASIFGRWTTERKKLLYETRILTTRNLVEAIRPGKDTVLFSTSAVGYYGPHGDEELDESSPPGEDFLANLAQDWEAEALRAREKEVRVVITRFGIVLGRDGGALQQMVAPFRLLAGGPMGSGLQWISWIHMEDLMGAYVHLLTQPDLSGPFNFTAPQPQQNRDLAKILGKVLGRPSWMPAPAFMIKLALGEFGSVLLEGQRVLPKKLLDSGFAFHYSQLEMALQDLLG
jgi:uncharacterized protein (TIGR01777 family)